MKNSYEVEVKAQCPVNPGDTDLYVFVLESESIIPVEKINEFFKTEASKKNVYQEDLTRLCSTTLGVKVKSIGWHSGVKVVSEAP